MAYNHLFSPIKIGNVEIPNRIGLMPMGVLSPRMMNRDASYTKDGADYYIERAKGGTGLIITGMAPIPPGEFLPSIVNNPATYTENTKYLADGVHCHFGCLARIVQFDYEKMALRDISCALNPRCGMENHYNISKAETKKKIAVVGGGIACMEAVRVCALRGHEVDLYEKNDVLGGIFIAAAAFDFKDDDRHLIEWYRRQMKETGVHVLLNTEFKPEDKDGYDEVFVATGAKERKLPTPGFDQPAVRYAVDVLQNQNIRGRAFNQSLQGIHRDVKPVEADTVIVSVGYTSNRELYDAIKGDNVHLLGDAQRPSNLMGCIWSAYTMCLNI